MDRQPLIFSFLSRNNLQNAHFKWLPCDASFRRYARIKDDKKSYILMDAPKDVATPENAAQFALVDEILCKNGLSAPIIYDKDLDNGLILLEDLGDDSYRKMLSKGFDELPLYKNALLSLLQIKEITDTTGVPDYDNNWICFALSLFLDWFAPKALNRELSKNERDEFYQIWEDLFASISDTPKGLILSDYHIDNLMYLNARKGHKACGLLDFQDARVGPLVYDLVSLLEDPRRDVPPKIREEILDLYLSKNPTLDKDKFMRAYHIVAVKRHTRVIGIFVRLKVRDGKDRYLNDIPRTWKMLQSHLSEPCMQPLKEWLDKTIAPELRAIPKCFLSDEGK